MGAANLAVGLGQGFPVTGADSRTAVNDAMGGRTQLVGIVAAGAMLLVLLTAHGTLGPGAHDGPGRGDPRLRSRPVRLCRPPSALRHEPAGGPAVVAHHGGSAGARRAARRRARGRALAVLASGHGHAPRRRRARPAAWTEGLSQHAGLPGCRDAAGLLLFRFNANIVFFNADYFCDRVRVAIGRSATPVSWVIVDLSPVSFVDATAMQRFDELREELAAQGITLGVAHAKRQLRRFLSRRGWQSGTPPRPAWLFRPSARRCRPSRGISCRWQQAAGICDPVTLDRAEFPDHSA